MLPIMSENACNTDTRFGRASDIVWEIEDICGRKIIKSIVEAEPIGPKKMCDIIVVAPCTEMCIRDRGQGNGQRPKAGGSGLDRDLWLYTCFHWEIERASRI